MSRARKEDSIVLSEMTTNPDRFFGNLRKLAFIVLHNHYSFVRDQSLQEDLVSEAVLKAWDLLKSGVFDPTRSTVRNYCYSGMRNQMQNIVYKKCKEISVDEVIYTEDTAPDIDEESTKFSIDEDLVYSICDIFYRLGNYHDLLIGKLRAFGLHGDDTGLDKPDKPNDAVLNACFIEYLWRVRNGTKFT